MMQFSQAYTKSSVPISLFQSSQMWCHVARWLVPDLSKYCVTFKAYQSMDWYAMKMKVLWSFNNPEITHPATQCNILEDWYPQLHTHTHTQHCENLKSCI